MARLLYKSSSGSRRFLALVAGATALVVTGCGSAGLFRAPVEGDDGISYDAQACVEHALRNAPDLEGMRDATVAFAEACRGGEAAACSALGVMYELGRGFAVDVGRARELFGVACETHNARACANLAALPSNGRSRAVESVATLQP